MTPAYSSVVYIFPQIRKHGERLGAQASDLLVFSEGLVHISSALHVQVQVHMCLMPALQVRHC
jgi:hypothetical protein